jgi:hypothetical protein
MENPEDQPLKVLKEQLTEYIDLKSEQARLGLIENSAKVTAYFSSAIIIIALVMFCLLSLLVAGSFFLGQALHSYGMGFLISAGIFLLLLILFMSVWRKKSESSIINKIIQLTNDDEQN